ncbi:hypothetical protein RND71_019603 [Anisodus tanguticus]|uniref:Remorin C-terminal domain-containing protein n=1 Tax=Anisodus tanguticus TaxID=243964 RepID=A0AAE1S155_9SOLA|nr:hypothetical protein RND71_019603 [Anisodus tanguticus]
MRKHNTSLRNSGTYTSPSTPEYGDNNFEGFQRGWYSKRVPLQTNSSRRHITATALMPFNSGRALPSKWDDAERWITSPLSGHGTPKNSNVQSQKQPKSKSGPLENRGVMYIPNFSPSVPVLKGGCTSNFIANSPFTTGVLVPDGLSIHYGAGDGARSSALYADNNMARASTAPGLSDFFAESSLPSSQDDKVDGAEEPDSISCAVSRRDMATQMSPDDSTHSSPKGRSPSMRSMEEPNNKHSAKVEIRDVQVDRGPPVSGESQKNGVRKTKKDLQDASDSNLRWDVADAGRSMPKLQREEARITAWENLQKAKAEAAIQKLEVKLAKKRSASMDKILNKLKLSQLKAQKMRGALSEGHPTSSKKLFPFQKYFKITSFSSCFYGRVY